MKKGCFLTVIIILTIILITVFYLVKFHGEGLLELGKEKLVEYAQQKIEDDLENLENGEYSDSLRIALKSYFSKIDTLDVKESLKRIEEFSDDFEVILMDSKIDSAEFEFITNLMLKYERRKKN